MISKTANIQGKECYELIYIHDIELYVKKVVKIKS